MKRDTYKSLLGCLLRVTEQNKNLLVSHNILDIYGYVFAPWAPVSSHVAPRNRQGIGINVQRCRTNRPTFYHPIQTPHFTRRRRPQASHTARRFQQVALLA